MTRDDPRFGLETANQRVATIYREKRQALWQRADLILSVLLVLQWIVAIACTLALQPIVFGAGLGGVRTAQYVVVLGGGVVVIASLAWISLRPGSGIGPFVNMSSQLLFSALFMHLFSPRSDVQFHGYVLLAFLALYRDRRIIVAAAAVLMLVSISHQASVGHVTSAWSGALGYVLESAALLILSRFGEDEAREVAYNQAAHDEALKTLVAQQQSLVVNAKMSALGTMAAGVAHEINNPLAIIMQTSGQLREMVVERETPSPAMVSEMSETLVDSSERIARIVRGLRLFARDGRHDEFQLVSLRQLIDDTLGFCKRYFQGVGIEIICEPFDQELTAQVRASEISQVILNLLNNARDAIEEKTGGKWIRLSVEDRGDDVFLSVTDCGDGLPPEVAGKIFQPFFTTKPVGKGTGMGLSIAREIARSHGGALGHDPDCENTRFVLRLPKRQGWPDEQRRSA